MKSIALIGLPNSGKSSLFNLLTNRKGKVANFSGVTVEKKSGEFSYNNQRYNLVDLPGIYTLDVSTLDEKVTKDYIFEKDEKADITLLVIDATNIKRALYLALQLKEIGQQFIVVLNMFELAKKRGLILNLEDFSDKLGVSVIKVDAKSGDGKERLLKILDDELKNKSDKKIEVASDFQRKIKESSYIKNKLSEVEQIEKTCIQSQAAPDNLTKKLDALFLHPFIGPIVLIITLICLFQLLFIGAEPFIGLIESLFEFLSAGANNLLPDGYLKDLIINGVLAGVGGVIVFVPHIFLLFFIIYFLEDFGYLGRAAFILDYLMRKMGLPGRAVVPLLSGHACAIPAIMSARIISNPMQRMVTMMVTPLTACSARLPVYTLIIAAIIPNERFSGLGLPGIVLFSLYLIGIISAFFISFILKKLIAKSSPSFLMMELPEYRVPSIMSLIRSSWEKAYLFIKKAGSVILILSIVIWFLVSFPTPPKNATQSDINYSYAARVGKSIAPLFSPLGFDWRLTTALIPSFAAREVLVSSLATVMSVQESDANHNEDSGEKTHENTDGQDEKSLKNLISAQFSFATMMALLVWFIYSPQCISTFAVLKKETNSYKMPIVYGLYSLFLAYVLSWITYLIFS